MDYEIIKDFQKANCHMHLTGSLNPDEVRSLAAVLAYSLEKFEPLESKWSFHNPTPWEIVKEITSNCKGLTQAIQLVIDREAQQKTNYLELTINPFGMIRRGLLVNEIVDVLNNSTAYAHSKGVTLRFKFGVNRKDGPGSIPIVREVFLACNPSIRSCIDLNGSEKDFPTKIFLPSFKALSSEGIPTCMHVAEYRYNDCTIDELLDSCPSRLAHATLMTEFEYSKIADVGLLVEISVTSNIVTGIISSAQLHPLRRMIDLGVQVVLGTDDPGIFDSSITEELGLLLKAGFSLSEIEQINNRGINLRNEK